MTLKSTYFTESEGNVHDKHDEKITFFRDKTPKLLTQLTSDKSSVRYLPTR